jgi:uncharacterized oxidoreductase
MKLSGRTILITGGSAGIGLAFAAKFIELGNEVIVTGRDRARLDEAKARHPKLHTIVSDVADIASVTALAAEVSARFPKLDVLMNNAGILVHRNVARGTTDLAALTTELDINVAGTIRTTAAFVELLKANHGAIINVTSGLAFVPLPSAPIYCATKAALHSYTMSLRFQLQDAGVEVVELMPPAIDTAINAGMPKDGDVKLISTDELVALTMPGLLAGDPEIRPGQANQLHWMSRIAPGFINGQLWKGSKGFVPAE